MSGASGLLRRSGKQQVDLIKPGFYFCVVGSWVKDQAPRAKSQEPKHMQKIRYFFVILLLSGFSGCSDPMDDVSRADRLALESGRNYAQAVGLYVKALGNLPGGRNKEETRLKLGRLYWSRGDFEAAERVLRLCASVPARQLLAQVLFKGGSVTDAMDVFSKAGESGPAEYRYYYGLTLEKNNLFDQALRLYASIGQDASFGPRARARTRAINSSSAQGPFSGVDPEIRKMILDDLGAEVTPDAGAKILLSDEAITLTGDNRLVSEAHYVVKILNDRGKEAHGEIVLGYDATYEKLDVTFARTISADGTVVTVGDKNIRDVSKYLNFPLYSNARARIISMPEVAPGSILEYKITLTQSKLPNKKDFDTVYWLQAPDPILRQRCRISVPPDKKCKTKIVNAAFNTKNFDMAPKAERFKNELVYTLDFQNVPQIIPEPAMPPESQINPYILFSTFEDWSDVAAWWRGLYQDKIAPDPAIRAKVASLIKTKASPAQKARAIYNFCVQEIRYVAVEYGDAGYEPHKATEIFANKYGDCKDKAILLVTMLAEAGIEAYPVLISTLGGLETQADMPGLLFNHAIAAVRLGGTLVFMDATASTTSFGDLPVDDQDRLALVFFPDRYELVRTPLFGPDANTLAMRMKIAVARDGSMIAERSVQSKGSYLQAQRYWLKYTMPALIEEGLKQKTRALADNAILEDFAVSGVDDLDAPIGLSYRFRAPSYFVEAGPIRILRRFGAIDTSGVSSQERRYPIQGPGLTREEDMIEIEFPPSLKVKYIPPDVQVQTSWFDFSGSYKVEGKNHLRFEAKRTFKVRLIPAEAYAEYKNKIEEIAASANQHVVLEEDTRAHGFNEKK
jgi:transglutaminase-like putative cysteine protease/tetratricopeptide (TPR) repeat protein